MIEINTLFFINALRMNKPESKQKVLDWILEHGREWFKPRNAVDGIYLNRSLIYSTLRTFHNENILIKYVTQNGKQNNIKYKLNIHAVTNILEEILESLEIMHDEINPYVWQINYSI